MPMWYWRGDNFRGLREIADALSERAELHEFVQYCRLREQGLRKEAFLHLEAFLQDARQWSFPRRRDFADSLMHLRLNHSRAYDLLPHPLRKGLVEPTLQEWIGVEPNNPVPHRWLGTLESLREAVRLDPREQIARRQLISMIAGFVHYGVHELPWYYCGSPEEDLAFLDEARLAAQGIADSTEQGRLMQEITDLQSLVSSYKEYKEGSRTTSFEEWACTAGRPSRVSARQVC